MIYLASPFSAKDYWIRSTRVNQAENAEANLLQRGVIVFSPVASSWRLVCQSVRPWNDPWWYEWSMDFLSKADEVWVLMLDGWRESKDVQDEMSYARDRKFPIRYVDPETLEVRTEP